MTIYSRNCDYCGVHYEKQNRRFCSLTCAIKARIGQPCKKKRWSNEEVLILQKHFSSKVYPKPLLLKCLPNRTWEQIKQKAHTLGLRLSSEAWRSICSISHKGSGCGWPKGKRHSEKTKRLISKAVRGKKHPLYGKKRPDFANRYGQKEEFERKRLTAVLKKHPNKPEKVLMDLIDQNGFPFKFVGDGSLIIAERNPDFVSTDDSKKIIELWGDWWHKKGHSFHEAEDYYNPRKRMEVFRQHGYEALILWESELNNPKEVIDRIDMFIGEGCIG